MENNNKLSKTYKEVAEEFLSEKAGEGVIESVAEVEAVRLFAKHLDSFKHITTELHLAAVLKAREIDREMILMLADVVGNEKLMEIAKIIKEKHSHGKKYIEEK